MDSENFQGVENIQVKTDCESEFIGEFKLLFFSNKLQAVVMRSRYHTFFSGFFFPPFYNVGVHSIVSFREYIGIIFICYYF